MSERFVNISPSEVFLSVAVTAHSEGRLLRPTLRSVTAAIGTLTAQSVRCELLIVLDNATEETAREAEHWLATDRVGVRVRLIPASFGDAGESRNAAARVAVGKYLAYCDGDDLVSSNYFSEALHMLQHEAGRLIVHPSIVVSFGARSGIWTIPATEDVEHLDLIRHNLWPSTSVSLRSTYLEFPYTKIRPEDGFGPEDWYWNIETSIAGILHRPAPDTMFFYRVRHSGGVNNRHLHSILPAYDLEGLIAAIPARMPAEPFVAQGPKSARMISLLRRSYRLARPVIRVAASGLSRATKEKLYAAGRSLVLRPALPQTIPANVATSLREASELEPALSWTAHGYGNLPEWHPHNDEYSAILIELVQQLRNKADAIVAVPWVGIGGADLVSLNYAKALAGSTRFGGRVTMLATYTPSRSLPHLVPGNVNFIQIPESFRDLTPDLQRRLLAQVFLLVKPKVVVSVNCFDVTNSLQLYSRQLASFTDFFLTLFAFDRIGDGYPVNPITDDSQRVYLNDITRILTDNTTTAALVSEMLALGDDKISVHHQPALAEIPPLRKGTRAYNNRYFSETNPFILVWPHRLDKEKRPDVLVEIAKRIRAEGLPVEIQVYGQQVLSNGGDVLMKALSVAGIKYKGPYSGGLSSLPTEDFHALLLTSESEGLPLVIVQSMLLGLPVISTDVGGVSDIVHHKDTGILAQGPDDIDGFIAGIRFLMDSLDDRRRIIDTAYDLAVRQHGWAMFSKLVADTMIIQLASSN